SNASAAPRHAKARTRCAARRIRSRGARSPATATSGATSALGTIRANSTTPTAPAPSEANATTARATRDAHSAVWKPPHASSALRSPGFAQSSCSAANRSLTRVSATPRASQVAHSEYYFSLLGAREGRPTDRLDAVTARLVGRPEPDRPPVGSEQRGQPHGPSLSGDRR